MQSQLPQPPLDASAAEQSPAARLGAVLFRNRGWLPIPFLAVPLLWPRGVGVWTAHASSTNWVTGLLLVAIGEWVRMSGVAAAGTVTRRRSRNVGRLVTYGAFSWVRNPLYVGNAIIWAGFIVIAGILWFLPIALLVFAVEYTLIVRYEEGVLESIFNEEYLAYKKTTPRWLARPPSVRARGEHDWGEAWRSEVSTFLQYGALIVLFVAKQRYW